MTTALLKAVARKTMGPVGERRRVVVTLYPGDVIGLRAERFKREYTVPLSALYSMAVKMHLADLRAQKAKARRSKR